MGVRIERGPYRPYPRQAFPRLKQPVGPPLGHPAAGELSLGRRTQASMRRRVEPFHMEKGGGGRPRSDRGTYRMLSPAPQGGGRSPRRSRARLPPSRDLSTGRRALAHARTHRGEVRALLLRSPASAKSRGDARPLDLQPPCQMAATAVVPAENRRLGGCGSRGAGCGPLGKPDCPPAGSGKPAGILCRVPVVFTDLANGLRRPIRPSPGRPLRRPEPA
jgi:hypothetical protein